MTPGLARVYAWLLGLLISLPAYAAAAPPPPLPIGGADKGGGAGFHLETAPFIDPVFGDASDYRKKIDMFLKLYQSEQPTREQFSSAVAGALADVEAERELVQEGQRRGCPADRLATPYARAYHLGSAYLKAGKEMSVEYAALRNLDALGETAGLTPDYKYKVKQAQALWDQVLADYREMHVAFHDELVPEIQWLGCDPVVLLAAGDAHGAAELAHLDGPDPAMPLPAELQPPPARPVARSSSSSQPATPPVDPRSVQAVSFAVDNTQCRSPVQVVLDGVAAGVVAGGKSAVFRATAGPHDLCALTASDKARCGDQGTVHSTHIYEGWTLTMKCAAPATAATAGR